MQRNLFHYSVFEETKKKSNHFFVDNIILEKLYPRKIVGSSKEKQFKKKNYFIDRNINYEYLYKNFTLISILFFRVMRYPCYLWWEKWGFNFTPSLLFTSNYKLQYWAEPSCLCQYKTFYFHSELVTKFLQVFLVPTIRLCFLLKRISSFRKGYPFFTFLRPHNSKFQ